MTSASSLRAVLDMLGEPVTEHGGTDDAWRGLEDDLGFALPDDYKTIVEAYAPVQLYEHLYLHHPATERWNLRRWISETVTAWSEVEWDDEIDGDPRAILGTDELRFGTPDGLTPLLGSDRGETVFLARDSAGKPLLFAENGEEEFFCQAIPFSEWLRQYVSGEDAVGPGSGILYPVPVKFRSLPVTPQDPMTSAAQQHRRGNRPTGKLGKRRKTRGGSDPA
ncbi:SMI1/KNR4 family protein [Streptomyces microflavus]|uniref:SMI1/KNR4 family protein n=1 Tax=Streptomyces microflavus TaxID=1919 RepID=UPI002E3031E3|nr:SMI1/KNR4 family protein [Streptomyces microflavus]